MAVAYYFNRPSTWGQMPFTPSRARTTPGSWTGPGNEPNLFGCSSCGLATADEEEKKQSQTLLIVGAAVAALGVLYLVMKS